MPAEAPDRECAVHVPAFGAQGHYQGGTTGGTPSAALLHVIVDFTCQETGVARVCRAAVYPWLRQGALTGWSRSYS